MVKTVIIALVLLGFAWAYQPTRARMVMATQPVLERMGPVGERIIRPIQRYNTKNEVSFIIDQIVLAKTEGREIPDERTFQRWMATRLLTKNHGKDVWGRSYFLIRVGSMLTVGSVGEDGQRGTADDIKKSVTL